MYFLQALFILFNFIIIFLMFLFLHLSSLFFFVLLSLYFCFDPFLSFISFCFLTVASYLLMCFTFFSFCSLLLTTPIFSCLLTPIGSAGFGVRSIAEWMIVLQYKVVPNSRDCWVSISGSGSDASFLCQTQIGTEPQRTNLELGSCRLQCEGLSSLRYASIFYPSNEGNPLVFDMFWLGGSLRQGRCWTLRSGISGVDRRGAGHRASERCLQRCECRPRYPKKDKLWPMCPMLRKCPALLKIFDGFVWKLSGQHRVHLNPRFSIICPSHP